MDNNYEVNIVRGDTLSLKINIDLEYIKLIKQVYFSNKKLNVLKVARFETQSNSFFVEISSVETELFSIGTSDFDIKIEFIDGDIQTALYRNSFNVFENVNKVK